VSIYDITAHTESRNRDFNPDGSWVTSPKGARGRMQVMPGTIRDPGYGVRPAANDSPDELARVGRDYLDAMAARYDGDMMKAWAAYNAGPGRVDRAIERHGGAWLSTLPAETRKYVAQNITMLRRGGSGGEGNAPAANPNDPSFWSGMFSPSPSEPQAASISPDDPNFWSGMFSSPRPSSGGPVNGALAVRRVLPDAVVTSGYRGPDHPLSKKNPDSWHAKSHGAVDIKPIPGMTFEQARAQLEAAGYQIIEALNEVGSGRSKHATGDHWHFVLGGGAPSRFATADPDDPSFWQGMFGN
jgi:hypothetical protein